MTVYIVVYMAYTWDDVCYVLFHFTTFAGISLQPFHVIHSQCLCLPKTSLQRRSRQRRRINRNNNDNNDKCVHQKIPFLAGKPCGNRIGRYAVETFSIRRNWAPEHSCRRFSEILFSVFCWNFQLCICKSKVNLFDLVRYLQVVVPLYGNTQRLTKRQYVNERRQQQKLWSLPTSHRDGCYVKSLKQQSQPSLGWWTFVFATACHCATASIEWRRR